MKVKFTRSAETGTSSAKLIIAGKQIDFEYPTFIRRLYDGEQIENIEYDPEDAFDATELETIESMINEIKAICISNDAESEEASAIDDKCAKASTEYKLSTT